MHWSVNAAEREEKEETEVETVCCGADMAGVSNEQIKQLSQKVYKSLQVQPKLPKSFKLCIHCCSVS